MPQRPGEKGQSLIQLMMVVAILGVLGILVARLMGSVTMGWFRARLSATMDFNAQAARRLLLSQMRDASASSVVLSRIGTNEPLLSKISWIDSIGNSRTVYQSGPKLYAANWSGCVTNTTQVQTVLRDGLERFQVYYPSAKDPTRVAFVLVLSKRVTIKSPSPVDLVVNGELEMKNP